MNRTRQMSRRRWSAGDALSWVLGVLLGGFLGTVLLIATPMMLRKAAPAAATPAPAATAPAATAPAATAPASTETATTPAATPAASATEPPAAGMDNAAEPAAGSAAGSADAGKELYVSATCAGCHGAQGQGGVGLPLNKPDGPMSWTDAQFATAIREGKTPTRDLAPLMPRKPELTDTQLADLHAFIKTLK